MRLTRLKVENHKRLADLEIEVRDHLVLVGANDVGKSSLLRCLDLLLGASTAQLYSHISAEDFRALDQPFVIEATLADFSADETALFPDEIDTTVTPSVLVIRLAAEVDPNGTVAITRSAPKLNTGRQLSREQLTGLGWKFLSATAQTRDLRDGRKSAVDDLLASVDLGEERDSFKAVTERFQEALAGSETLGEMRDSLASQLSRALPKTIQKDDLSFVSRASADDDPLSDVRLRVQKDGAAHDLAEQSDGTRALYAIALYDLMSVGSNVVGIDEPEVHLHPTSQRSLARLLKQGANQKILATHSPDIVGVFDPDSIVVVKSGGKIVQPRAGFMSDDEKQFVRWWVRDKLEPLTATRVVAVEGVSDRIILERAADLTNRQLDRLGVSVLEVGGSGDMGVIDKLFGKSGFNIPMTLLIDADAEVETAKKLRVAPADLPAQHVWVSRRDLEAEYVRALGVGRAWEALTGSGLLTKTQLGLCGTSGPSGERTIDDVAEFCRMKKHKVPAALSIAAVLDEADVVSITSIENVLAEVAA